MFHFQLGPEFKASAARLAQPLAPYAARLAETLAPYAVRLAQTLAPYAARLAQQLAPMAPYAEKTAERVLAGARNPVIAGVAGWGAVVIAGAVLMANAAPDRVAPPTPLASAAALVAPAPAPVKAEPLEVAVQPAKPAPPPVAAKTTQRVDMTPTASIPAEPAHKPKHKPHKKKVDNPN